MPAPALDQHAALGVARVLVAQAAMAQAAMAQAAPVIAHAAQVLPPYLESKGVPWERLCKALGEQERHDLPGATLGLSGLAREVTKLTGRTYRHHRQLLAALRIMIYAGLQYAGALLTAILLLLAAPLIERDDDDERPAWREVERTLPRPKLIRLLPQIKANAPNV